MLRPDPEGWIAMVNITQHPFFEDEGLKFLNQIAHG
jgi:hypothetical protein